MILRLACVLALLGPVANGSAQQYRDSYPKNPDIDMVGYVFNLTFSDDSDSVRGVATASARYQKAGHGELRLDLIERSDALEVKGMTVYIVEMDG